MKTLNKTIQDQINKLNPSLLDKLTEKLVQIELNRRSALLFRAFQKIEYIDGKLQKLTEKSAVYSDNGEKTAFHWKKEDLEEKNKLEGEKNRIENAFNKAIENGQYGEIEKCLT